jgi:hypothetical protein
VPPLEPTREAAPLIPQSLAVNGGTSGLPLRLERLSAKELAHPSERFALDLPYTATPTGWGEWIPVLPGEAADPIVVLAQPTSVVV